MIYTHTQNRSIGILQQCWNHADYKDNPWQEKKTMGLEKNKTLHLTVPDNKKKSYSQQARMRKDAH